MSPETNPNKPTQVQLLIAEISDSLVSIIDTARSLRGAALSNVITGLELVQQQVRELDKLTEKDPLVDVVKRLIESLEKEPTLGHESALLMSETIQTMQQTPE